MQFPIQNRHLRHLDVYKFLQSFFTRNAEFFTGNDLISKDLDSF